MRPRRATQRIPPRFRKDRFRGPCTRDALSPSVMGVSGVRCVQSGPVEAAQVIPESKGSALLVAARTMVDRMAQLDIVVSSDRADPDQCRRPPSARRMSAPLARGRALLCRVGDPSPLNPVRVEWGSRGESVRIMADKPARPLGFGQSRRATPVTPGSAPS